jgi:hypothetical protein
MSQAYIGVNKQYRDRNQAIYREWLDGASMRDIAWRRCLRPDTVRCIIHDMKEMEQHENNNIVALA